jgi:dTDP-4-amino-4,6-dideoxygalactose transaminase
MVVTRDAALAHGIRLLRGYGQDPARSEAPAVEQHRFGGMEHVVEGYNLRLDSLQAAILRAKFPHLAAWRTERARLAARYTARFAGSAVRPPVVRVDRTHSWRDYVIQVDRRDAVRARLLQQGIVTTLRYAPPVHRQPVYRHLGLGEGSVPVAEAAARRLLGLPIYPGLRDEDVDLVADSVLAALASR